MQILFPYSQSAILSYVTVCQSGGVNCDKNSTALSITFGTIFLVRK